MATHDIRWIQRFQNYQKALHQLQAGLQLMEERELNNLEKQGLIQAFEFTHELAWKTLKDFLMQRGNPQLYGSKDATREAFKTNLISEGQVWMEMIESRNMTSHTYDEATAEKIIEQIRMSYLEQFLALAETLLPLKEEEEQQP